MQPPFFYLITFLTFIFDAVTSFTMSLPNVARINGRSLMMQNEFEIIGKVQVKRADSGNSIFLTDAFDTSDEKTTVIAFLTHFADFNAWEYAQKLKHYLADFSDNNVDVVAIGIGTMDAAKKFAAFVDFPESNLYADETAEAHRLLDFSKGLETPFKVTSYLRLLLMLSGIGSPGTIQAVLKGYVGDKNENDSWLNSSLTLVDREKFDAVGKQGTRPFEVATLRLQNMIQILKHWNELSPPNKDLITWQGGTLVFKGAELIYKYSDKGILTYTPIEEILQLLNIS